jgi:hypothetical protein
MTLLKVLMRQCNNMHCYTWISLFEWVSHLSIIDFYYNCSTTETLTYLVSCEYQPAALVDLLLPMIVAPPIVADHFSKLACA